jgi:hypothetical protein
MALVTKSEFAKLAGVKKPSVSYAVGRGLIAVVDDKIDTENPVTITYLRRNRGAVKPKSTGKKMPRRPPKPPPTGLTDDDDDEVLDRNKWELKKIIEQTRGFELKNAETEGRLVSFDLVEKGVFGPIETCWIRMLADGSKTIAAQIHPMIMGGATIEETELFIQKQIGTYIKATKKQVKKTLRDYAKSRSRRRDDEQKIKN